MHVHVVGIGGAGMSAIARHLLKRMTVSGSDAGRWPLSEALVPLGARVYDTFDAANIVGADVVLRSSAYGDANLEVRAARERGVPIWNRADAWRLLAGGQRVVAVAGTHGKTTTTAMTWSALRGAGMDPSLVCGAAVAGLGTNAHVGADAILVIEADEYDHAFLSLDPAVAVVLNVDHDHVDLFPTRDDYREAFEAFAQRVVRGGTLVTCADDAGSAALASWAVAALPGRSVVTYGIAGSGFRLAGDVVELPDGGRMPLRLRVPGAHNRLNALAAVTAAAALGGSPAAAIAGVEAFDGTERRLETLGSAGGVVVIDDYAHHPAEIRASIEAVRGRGGRLVVAFQPHTPSRLAAFAQEFADALRQADSAMVVETFSSAREQPAGGARELAQRAGARYAHDNEEAARLLAADAQPGDVVLILGAGDVRTAGARLLELLRSAPV